MDSKLLIGTSGWSYPKGEGSWKGYFYPQGTKDELGYYSQLFNTVEINSSFYRPPTPDIAESWIRRTPDEFVFSAKLWQKFTHPKMFKEATGLKAEIRLEDVNLFNDGMKPLLESGKLGALLAQFPPSFENNEYGHKIIRALIETFGHYPLAVEFRHRSWSDDPNTESLLSANNVCWVRIDEPKFRFSVARETPLTSDLAYFRFHGRNKEMWWIGDNETRYKYLYSPEEISELAQEVKETLQKMKSTFVYFNNHWQGFAPKNAAEMTRALAEQS
jgi:uncharacterized protein YecE (DUF72 family)